VKQIDEHSLHKE